MIDIVDRLRLDAALCEATFSRGVATNIEEGASEIERLRRFVDFVNLWAWLESKISDTERLSAIKYHPTAKAAREFGNEQSPKIVDYCSDCGAEIAEGDIHGCPGRPGENHTTSPDSIMAAIPCCPGRARGGTR